MENSYNNSYSLLYKRRKQSKIFRMIKFCRTDLLYLDLPSRDIMLYFERAFRSVFDCLQNGVVRFLMKFSWNEEGKRKPRIERIEWKKNGGENEGIERRETRSERGAKRQGPYKNGSRSACTSVRAESARRIKRILASRQLPPALNKEI